MRRTIRSRCSARSVTAEQVLADVQIWPGVMTRLMACPPTCGAAAAVLVSEDYARQHGIDTTVRILAQAMTTDTASTFGRSMISLVGADMAKAAADAVYEQAGIGPDDIDVCELHDCFAHNELISYEALGFCAPGEAARSSSPTATTPTAARSSPIRPAACCPRAIRSARPGSRSASN